eukprot:1545680-Amphidinium_carterae.2
MVEACSGSGRLSAACREVGLGCVEWDVKHGTHMDQVPGKRKSFAGLDTEGEGVHLMGASSHMHC